MKSVSSSSCAQHRGRVPLFRRPGLLRSIASLLAAAALVPVASAQAPAFSYSRVNGLKIGSNNKASKVTSLQFGPDNRLYYVQSNGIVGHCVVTRVAKDNYQATDLQTIDLVKNIPNYDDDGNFNSSLTTRQATGILVTGTAVNPVIYVTSSDPREGAGSGATDLNLDTNSGTISRLTKNGSGVWEKVDIVRGLPRSEENHATNGLTLSADGNTLYVAQGGSTNAGAPSNNFAFACEQALAAAVLSVDLAAINALPVLTDSHGQNYLYNLPTVDDPNPSRADVLPGDLSHADANDPFGGNDGLNQGRIVEGGPVQVYASGFRNPYDVMIARTPHKVGKMYTIDNAANSGWGGYPKNEGTANVTNEWVSGEPGTVNNKDGLHLIGQQGYYGGHPNPIRANPATAGWSRYDGGTGGAGLVFSTTPTVDWPPVPLTMADPQQGDFRMPDTAESLTLTTNNASTTGLAEYTAGNFGGQMIGNIICTMFNGGAAAQPKGAVQRIVMNQDGTQVLSKSIIFEADGYGSPLDVTVPGPDAAPELTGTIFVGHYLSSDPGITVLEPTDFETGGGVCTGLDSYTLDEDGDGYSNADEILNESDPCSPGVQPADFDLDFLSNLLDTDDDNDGIADSQDVFPIDALNGRNVAPPLEYNLFNTMHGFFAIGFTGVMLEPGLDYTARMATEEIIAGGTAGLYTDPSMGPGTPHGSANTQMNAFQFGVSVDETTGPFRVISGLGGLLFNGTPTGNQSQGIFIGNGDQDNYVQVAVNANGGPGAIEIVHEENGVILSQSMTPQPGLFGEVVQLSFLVDPIGGTVQPGYAIGSGSFINVGSPLTVGGRILDCLRGKAALAVGLLGSTGGGPVFNATWDYFEVLPVASTASATLTVNSSSGSLLSSSTNTSGSFQLQNTSTGGQKIVEVKVDLSTALLPDIVFDPFGTAGDLDGKGFQLDSFNGSGPLPTGDFEAFHNGVDSIEGFDVLKITCDPATTFGPGHLLTFSSDVDPTSVKGVTGPGPNHAASVSGLELIGTTVTVTFDDGSVRKIRNAGLASGDGHTNKRSVGVLHQDNLPTPTVYVPGKSSPFVTNSQPTVRIVGPAGSSVQVWTFHTGLYSDPIIPPYDIDPFEANNVIAFNIEDAVIGAGGYVDVAVTLSSENGGINYVSALFLDGTSRSSSSNILVIDYDPNSGSGDALLRVNAGGDSYVDTASNNWAADTGFTSGSTQSYPNEISGTDDDALYQTFRFDASPSTPLDYSFGVTNGDYEVKLHFAETWDGITASGQRVFDVLLENQTVLNDFDVFAVAGPNNAHVETFQTTVSDGQLTIGLRHVVQNPMICAIEVFSLGGGPGTDTTPPTAPGSLATTNLKAGSLTLTWTASTDDTAVTGYRIFRDGVEIATTANLGIPQTGLTPDTEYDYEVEAYDAAGNLSPRSLLTVITPADTENPTSPPNFKGHAGNESATLSWNPSSDDAAVTGYRVYRDGNLLATVTGLGYFENGLTNGTNYLYEVIAIDATGKTSAPASVIVRPRAIAGVTLRMDVGSTVDTVDSLGNTWLADFGYNAGLLDNNNLSIANTEDDIIYNTRRYDGPSGAELKYTLPVADGDYELRLHFVETTSSFQAVGTRVFDVKVQNQLFLDDFDIFATAGYATALVVPVPVTVTNGTVTIEFLHIANKNNPVLAGLELYELEPPPPDTLAPTAPGHLAVSGVTAGSVSLSWTASLDNVGVTAYQVSRNGGVPTTVTGLAFTDTGLLPGTTYDYSVVALDAAMNASPESTVQGTTTADTTPPTAPGGLTGSSGNAIATLAWNASSDDVAVTGYRIYRDDVLIETVDTPGYTASGLVNETAYVFKVTAIDAFSNESPPSEVTVTPRALGPALVRVDCGSSTNFVDPQGNTWSADFGFQGAPDFGYTPTSSTTNTISGTDKQAIYQNSRMKNRNSSRPLKYSFPVANGDYEVRLHFCEFHTEPPVAVGYRVFDVLAEGAIALDDFDIYATGGKDHAVMQVFPVTVADGSLTLDFTVVTQNPSVSAIEVFPILSGAAGETEPPTAPGDLAVTNLTSNSVSLGWIASTDNVGVGGYRIYRDSVLISTVTGLSFTNNGLSSGTLYHYSVVAFDLAGNTSSPAIVDATTPSPDLIPPSTPANLAGTPGLSQIALSWDASTDDVAVTGYRVLRDGNLITTVPGPGYTDTGLPSATEFDYEVIAMDAAGNLSGTASLTISTQADSEAPTVPGGLAAIPSYTSVALSWNASTDNAGVTGYRVYRGATLLATVPSPGYVDTGLTPDTPYHYEVAAIDSANNVSGVAAVDTATLEDAVAPAVPVGFDAVAGDGSVSLTWVASSDNVGVTGYEIRRNSALIATVPDPGYSDTGLTNGVLYSYEVRALDAAGNASADATDAATPRALGANLYRVDSGYTGEPFQDLAGNTWVADTDYVVFGAASSTNNAISGTEDDAIYNTERYDSTSSGANLSYDFPLAAGTYEVRLHFAETWSGITAAGQRVFDVTVEGSIAIDDLDIFARVGPNAALVMSFPVEVADGVLDLEFHHGVQNPKVCAIEIFAVESEGGPLTFEQWLIDHDLAGQTAADSDGGGLDNLAEFELQLDPNDPLDDLSFSLAVQHQAGSAVLVLPELKPIGNYHVHRDNDLDDIGNVANRIDTVTKAEVEAMTPAERANYTVEDSSGGTRAFYQLFFEPVAD
jgi:chitodextrinase